MFGEYPSLGGDGLGITGKFHILSFGIDDTLSPQRVAICFCLEYHSHYYAQHAICSHPLPSQVDFSFASPTL